MVPRPPPPPGTYEIRRLASDLERVERAAQTSAAEHTGQLMLLDHRVSELERLHRERTTKTLTAAFGGGGATTLLWILVHLALRALGIDSELPPPNLAP